MTRKSFQFIMLALYTTTIYSLPGLGAGCIAADSGKTQMNAGFLEFCDGSNWLPMGKPLTGQNCPTPGLQKMFATAMKFCSPIIWYDLSCNVTASTCLASATGKQRFSGGLMQYCNGSNWIDMTGGSCAVAVGYCPSFFDMASCTSGTHPCIWTGAVCNPDCSYGTPAQCATHPDCSWVPMSGGCLPIY